MPRDSLGRDMRRSLIPADCATPCRPATEQQRQTLIVRQMLRRCLPIRPECRGCAHIAYRCCLSSVDGPALKLHAWAPTPTDRFPTPLVSRAEAMIVSTLRTRQPESPMPRGGTFPRERPDLPHRAHGRVPRVRNRTFRRTRSTAFRARRWPVGPVRAPGWSELSSLHRC